MSALAISCMITRYCLPESCAKTRYWLRHDLPDRPEKRITSPERPVFVVHLATFSAHTAPAGHESMAIAHSVLGCASSACPLLSLFLCQATLFICQFHEFLRHSTIILVSKHDMFCARHQYPGEIVIRYGRYLCCNTLLPVLEASIRLPESV